MKKSLIALAVLACMAGAHVRRARTHDVAFTYRMGAGFPGDVNRTHPASIVPGLMDADDPIDAYGYPALIDNVANSYRGVLTADQGSVTSIAGVLVRPYPTQQTTGGLTATLGAAAAPTAPAVIDVLEDGFIMVLCQNFAAAPPAKGTAAYVWAAATAGEHIEGAFEASASGGNTILLTNAEFNGPPDASGVCELRVWKAKRT